MGIGKILVQDGYLLLLGAGIARLLLWVLFKYCIKKN